MRSDDTEPQSLDSHKHRRTMRSDDTEPQSLDSHKHRRTMRSDDADRAAPAAPPANANIHASSAAEIIRFLPLVAANDFLPSARSDSASLDATRGLAEPTTTRVS
jgi:hypothetical protein